MKTLTSILVLIVLIVAEISPQTYWERRFKDYNNPDELVTLSQTLPFNEAIELLSKVSESTTGRRIVTTIESTLPIGIEIENMPYDKALLIIVQYNGFVFEEKEDVIIVKRPQEDKLKGSPETYASVDSREVKISALFFEMDVSESKKRGIDWKFLFSKNGLNIGTEMRSESESTGGSTGQQTTNPAEFNVDLSSDFDVGGFFGQATAMFKLFEEENLGEIIANPSIIVRDRNQGRIQVGSDFSVRTRDFAGNTVEKFFPTGTIIEVTPYVYQENDIDYVLLNILVERSSFSFNDQTTEIRKTNASTQVLMLNGEETVLGGLFVNEESKTRNGIPILKDLPWWVFGIRYLTGSDQTEIRKKELVILLKAELVPTLKDRFTNPNRENLVKKEIDDANRMIRYYQMNSQTTTTTIEE